MKYKYACVCCPDCAELIPFLPIGRGPGTEEFNASDPGPLWCSRNHLRMYKVKDVRVVELDQPKRIARGK